MLKRIECAENENVRVHGRTAPHATKAVPLLWTASAIELNVTGTELWLEYECIYNGAEAYLRVEIDGADMLRFMLEEGIHKVCLMRGFEPQMVKNICIYRESQASETIVNAIAVYSDGELLCVPEKRLMIEFLGDSVTSGEGLLGAKQMMTWIPCIFGTKDNYALLTAKRMDADWSIVSQSGWGIYCSWDNNIHHNIPEIYEYVCAAAKAPEQISCGSQERYDFSKRKTDFTVVNLGANDCGAFNNAQWVDEDGTVYKQRLDDAGYPYEQDAARVTESVRRFCTMIRKNNPETIILWCYNMLGDMLEDAIVRGVNQYIEYSGDDRVYLLELPQVDESMNGSRVHPGPPAHRLYSELITNKLNEIADGRKMNF